MKQTVLRIAAVVLLGSAVAAQAEDLHFTLINKTEAAVTGFYVSHTRSGDWEENLLPDDHILAGGYEVDVIISDGRDTCDYDILVELEDGDTLEDYDIDLCDLGSYSIEEN